MKTYELVSRNYWWPSMSLFVKKYVAGCDICQRMKNHPQQPYGPLMPNPVPHGPWEIISVDLITQLPRSRGYDSIAVYVDHHSGQVHCIPCKATIDAEGTADLHYKEIFRLHGIPLKVYSDRGPQFSARFMRALYKLLGIETGLTTAFHPQGNGKVERMNQMIEMFLRLFVNARQDDWADYLPTAEFTINSRVSSSTGHSSFEVVYRYNPPSKSLLASAPISRLSMNTSTGWLKFVSMLKLLCVSPKNA